MCTFRSVLSHVKDLDVDRPVTAVLNQHCSVDVAVSLPSLVTPGPHWLKRKYSAIKRIHSDLSLRTFNRSLYGVTEWREQAFHTPSSYTIKSLFTPSI